jgi:site-specific DNA-cytosine methylase
MITAGDFLAGGGGVTYALRQIKNVQVKFVLNHDKEAIRTNLFNNLGLSRKKQTKLIGNAVPPQWAKIIIQPVIESLDHIINAQQKQVI